MDAMREAKWKRARWILSGKQHAAVEERIAMHQPGTKEQKVKKNIFLHPPISSSPPS
jgi:hypothetical protein